jgi:hypothetical protein
LNHIGLRNFARRKISRFRALQINSLAKEQGTFLIEQGIVLSDQEQLQGHAFAQTKSAGGGYNCPMSGCSASVTDRKFAIEFVFQLHRRLRKKKCGDYIRMSRMVNASVGIAKRR